MLQWNGYLFHPAKQIVRGLWIGSERDAADLNFLKKHKIRLIVNATDAVPVYSNIKTMRVPVEDASSSANRMAKYVPMTTVAINDVLRHGQNVLVHCRAGMNRSATVVAAYLMFSKGLAADRAMAFIKKRKPECFTPMNFKSSLNSWETKLRANGKIPVPSRGIKTPFYSRFGR
jgi:dual specificity MAP kinase phosphatase